MRIKAGNTLTEELHTLVLPTGFSVAATDKYAVVTGGSTGGYMVVPFSRSGDLVVTAGAAVFPVPIAATIVAVLAAVGTAPVGADVICDVDLNGTSVFTTTANRPTIADGGTETAAAAVPDVTALTAGDLLSVDIDQIGSTTAGANLTVSVLLQVA